MSRRLRRGVLRTSAPRARWYGSRSGVSRCRARSSAPALRAATRITATTSGESHSPSTYDSASPRLPRSSARQARGEATWTIACGGPLPSSWRREPSTIVRLP